MLQAQLKVVALFNPEEPGSSEMEAALNEVWANNGDAVREDAFASKLILIDLLDKQSIVGFTLPSVYLYLTFSNQRGYLRFEGRLYENRKTRHHWNAQ
jgi:hypothetical protein